MVRNPKEIHELIGLSQWMMGGFGPDSGEERLVCGPGLASRQYPGIPVPTAAQGQKQAFDVTAVTFSRFPLSARSRP